MVAAQNPEIFRVSVDLRPIAEAIVRYHNKLEKQYHATHAAGAGDCVGCDDDADIEDCVGCDEPIDILSGCIGCDETVGGFFGSIGKVIKKVGKNKLINKVAKVGKTIIKSKVTGAVLAGTAVIFPPVGAPALGAYVAANAALAAVEKANALKKSIQKAVSDPKSKAHALVKKVQSSASAKAKLQKIEKQAKVARKFIQTQRAIATYSPDPVKKQEAEKAVHVLATVAKHREALKKSAKKTPQKGITGLVVDGRGRITRGKFIREKAAKDAPLQMMLSTQGKVLPGYFRKVGGCIGCF
jgi:hypothetical protein